jgi:hypothetical protein
VEATRVGAFSFLAPLASLVLTAAEVVAATVSLAGITTATLLPG